MLCKLLVACTRGAARFLAAAALCGALHAQTPPEKVGIDDQGNTWVATDDGKRLLMADRDHCLESSEAPDRLSMTCLVSRGVAGDGAFEPSLQLEIYRVGGRTIVLSPGGAIREWRFWNDGQQVAVSFQNPSGEREYALYDSGNGSLIELIPEPADLTQLPQWARGRAQVDDDSVSTGPAAAEDRSKWIAKVMRQIEAIKPGMHRQDLAALFREDGGVTFFGGAQRYVLKECSMIKIDVKFKISRGEPMSESPDDVIESVSNPYLQYPIYD